MAEFHHDECFVSHPLYPRHPSVTIDIEIGCCDTWISYFAYFVHWIEQIARRDGIILDVCSCLSNPASDAYPYFTNTNARPIVVQAGIVTLPKHGSDAYRSDEIADMIELYWMHHSAHFNSTLEYKLSVVDVRSNQKFE